MAIKCPVCGKPAKAVHDVDWRDDWSWQGYHHGRKTCIVPWRILRIMGTRANDRSWRKDIMRSYREYKAGLEGCKGMFGTPLNENHYRCWYSSPFGNSDMNDEHHMLWRWMRGLPARS